MRYSNNLSHKQLNQALPNRIIKKESSEEILKQDFEEGKSGLVSDLLIKSPNLQKKKMDFGNGKNNEFVWFYSANTYKKKEEPKFVDEFQQNSIIIQQAINKWDRTYLLDSKGRIFEWNSQNYLNNQRNPQKKQIDKQQDLKELEQEVDGKALSSHKIRDINCTSSSIFMSTENGEVLVGKVSKNDNESESQSMQNESRDDLFVKRFSKINHNQKVHFTFYKLNSIQSHFISQIACGSQHALLLTQSGFVYSFGKNEYSQLGQQQQQDNQVNEPTILFQLLNLKVFSIGVGKQHNIVIGTARDTLTQTFQIYSTDNALYTTIDKNKTLVYGWGYNKHGQLGLSDDKNRSVPTLLETVLDQNFRKVSCGNYHSALLDEDGNAYLFGNNEFGQVNPDLSIKNQRTPLSLFNSDDNSHDNEIQFTNQQNQKFIIDLQCIGYSSILISDDNEIFHSGKNIFNKNKNDQFLQPQLIYKAQNGILPIVNDDLQYFYKVYCIKGQGILLNSQQRQLENNEEQYFQNDYKDQMFHQQNYQSVNQNQFQSSTSMSKGSSFQKNDNIERSPLENLTQKNGISFTKEFENLLQYIAITAGNTKMPSGIKPMSFRPSNLPPKTDEEEKLHQKMVEENRKQYVRKLKEKERLMQKQRYEQEVKEQRMHDMKNIWEKEIFPNWDYVKRTKRVRELWIEGLPPVIRGRVWYYAFGNRSSISKDLYNIMAEKGCKLRKILKDLSNIDQEIVDSGGQSRRLFSNIGKENEYQMKLLKEEEKKNISKDQKIQQQKLQELNKKYDKMKKKLNLLINLDASQASGSQSREKSINIIETDIPRTFPMLGFFKQGGVYYEQLLRILEAFTIYRPDIGYVQGMSYVAATLLLYMDEHSSFITFCNLITKFPIMPFYNFNEVQVKKIMQLFKQVFQHNLPDLCDHLEMENIQPKQYVYEWFMTLFTRALNLSLVSRVWDFYFLDGIFVLYQTAIAILRILERQLIEVDFEGIMKLLKNVQDYISDEEELVSYIYDVSFPKWVYDEIPKLESEFLQSI